MQDLCNVKSMCSPGNMSWIMQAVRLPTGNMSSKNDIQVIQNRNIVLASKYLDHVNRYPI